MALRLKQPEGPGQVGKRKSTESLLERALASPARLTLILFSSLIALFTWLLSLPAATRGPEPAPLVDAFFVATSAVTVTGLTTVDSGEFWSPFGLFLIITAVKLGGLGLLTVTALMVLMVSQQLGIREKMLARTESKAIGLGSVRQLMLVIVAVSAVCEIVVGAVLFPRFLTMGEPFGVALAHSAFYGISAYNGSGFVAHPGGLPGNPATDWWLSTPIGIGVLLGSLGVAVQLDMVSKRPRSWTLHTRLTLVMTGLLTVIAFAVFLLLEWRNDGTFGPLPLHGKIQAAFFGSLTTRMGGFNVVSITDMHPETWWFMDALMFIGGGSGSTSGGIRVTTLAVLFLAAWAEARGKRDIEVFRKRIPPSVVRISVAVFLAGLLTTWVGTIILLSTTNVSLDQALFEAASAFATVGLSTGVTPELPAHGKVVVGLWMLIGRTGLLTLAAALAMRERVSLVRYPEERPTVG